MVTLLGTNISHFKGTFEDDFPIPQVGYVNSLVGTPLKIKGWNIMNPGGLG